VVARSALAEQAYGELRAQQKKKHEDNPSWKLGSDHESGPQLRARVTEKYSNYGAQFYHRRNSFWEAAIDSDERFRRAMQAAVERGEECAPMAPDTSFGTK
jgi:hypothetical protein